MRRVVAFVLMLAAFVAIAVSMAMNYSFWTAQGVDAATSRVLGAVSIMIDVFKALLPLAIAWAWIERFRLGAGIATLLFMGCLAFSFMSALGFAAWTRGEMGESHAAQTLRYAAAKTDLENVNRQLATVVAVRATPVVLASVERAKQDKRWQTSEQCRDATTGASRTFCAAYGDLQIEVASAVERDKTERLRAKLQSEIDALIKVGARLSGDVQAGILSNFSGMRQTRVQKGLTLLVALVVEGAAGFGLFLASLPLRGVKPSLDVTVERDRSRDVLAKRLASAKSSTRPTRLVRTSDGQLMIE
ncbi:hypothetical protein [Hyphomicrobium sp.]|jgi:hypothetical protein|uniref:hypothetical protein n=1 Tax=Hyphomicrobium sp. TaxID=82 RepID=UPI0035668369